MPHKHIYIYINTYTDGGFRGSESHRDLFAIYAEVSEYLCEDTYRVVLWWLVGFSGCTQSLGYLQWESSCWTSPSASKPQGLRASFAFRRKQENTLRQRCVGLFFSAISFVSHKEKTSTHPPDAKRYFTSSPESNLSVFFRLCLCFLETAWLCMCVCVSVVVCNL